MNVKEINEHLSRGEIDREDMWPRIMEYESKSLIFPFQFGIKELPKEPGIITVRGPRQFGKSTWLDVELRHTIQEFGKGTAYYLNGDELAGTEDLYSQLISLCASFKKNAKIKRIFIDEISAVPDWENAVKRAYDQGPLRDVLLVTTGSKASDLRRGAERLPGRKGNLPRNDFIFLPVSYRAFYQMTKRELGDKTWIAYLLAGGSPLGCNEIYRSEYITPALIQLQRDWILGEIIESGRSRISINALLALLYRHAGTPVGFAKLARESGLANNTVASGYVEQLSDLLTLIPNWPYDASKKVFLLRRPCKFQFINLSAAIAFHPRAPRYVHEFERLPEGEQGALLEWLAAQEIWRRHVLNHLTNPEEIGFWQSAEHEIDFYSPLEGFVEVKRGKTSPMEFDWFSKVFPKEKLTVISSTPFETKSVQAMTMHDYLIADGQPPPFAGEPDF